MKKALPRREHEERQTAGIEAIGALLVAAKKNRLYTYWCALLYGGLRPSEALALRWEDTRGDTVHVNRVLVDVERRKMYFAPLKSKKSRRVVVLPAVAIEALREHWRRGRLGRIRGWCSLRRWESRCGRTTRGGTSATC